MILSGSRLSRTQLYPLLIAEDKVVFHPVKGESAMKTTSSHRPSLISCFLRDFAIGLLIAPFALILGAIAISLVALALM